MTTTPTSTPTFIGKVVQTTREGLVVLAVSQSDYRLHVVPPTGFAPAAGEKVTASLHAQAMRVDAISAGGRYIEPVDGRPRRVQGTVLSHDPASRTITVAAGVPVVCTLTDTRQKPADFPVGTMVSFDVKRGAGIRV